jgi:predicted DsbA family dithiol-disulfide isomerase
MSAVLDIATDLHCPFSYVCVLRLRQTRDALRLDVVLRHLYWPLELVNGEVTAAEVLAAEVPVLAQLEPEAFAAWNARQSLSTFFPAFELVKAAEEQGLRRAEDLDAALRRAYFLERRNLSLRPTLFEIAAGQTALDQAALRGAFDSGHTRQQVIREYAEVNERGIDGIPTVYLPGGERIANPGLSVQWTHGIPHVLAEDVRVYERVLRAVI